MIERLSAAVLPIVLVSVSLVFLRKEKVLQSFFNGAEEGIRQCVSLLPTLLLIMCGVNCIFSSGAVDVVCALFEPLLVKLGISGELLPSIVLRPFSGSAVTAVAEKLFADIGPDSAEAKSAGVLMGCTDTIIYTLSVYFSSCKIKRTRYALPASFIVFIFSIFIGFTVANLML